MGRAQRARSREQPAVHAAQAARLRVERILTERERLIGLAATLRRQHAASTPFLDKAEAMLTRLWGRARWSGREQLLKSAQWLIRLQQENTELPAAPRGLGSHAALF